MRHSSILAPCLVVLSQALPATAADTLWQTIEIDGSVYKVHVVSASALGNGFPERALDYDLDVGVVTDVYILDVATGDPVDEFESRKITALVQSALKWPAIPSAPLAANVALDDADLVSVPKSYPLLTSYYFDSDYVETFLTSGAKGLDVESHRAEIYREIFVDMALQPDLADGPGQEARYQAVLDWAAVISGASTQYHTSLDLIDKNSDLLTLPWGDYQALTQTLATKAQRFFDVEDPYPFEDQPAPLNRLATVLDTVDQVTWITSATARTLLLETLAFERGLMRIRILEGYVERAMAAGGIDPAMETGLALAKSDLVDLVDDYFFHLDDILEQMFLEDPEGILKLAPYAKMVVRKWLSGAQAARYAKVLYPYVLSYKVYHKIRAQQDRSQVASVAATLQRKLFESPGLPYHRANFDVGSGHLDGHHVQAFAEIYQMSWYLAALHYGETLNTLNNKLSRLYGLGIDLFTPGGAPYADQMDLLRHWLSRARTAAERLQPNGYLAAVGDFVVNEPQEAELTWLMSLIRGEAISTPSPAPSNLLGLCITLPWDPGGTPASAEGMNIRLEPRSCSDPLPTQAWECSDNDPDGRCNARVQLFWDDDKDPENADCGQGSGPCPIAGAEDLNPERGTFLWEAANDGLVRGSYYVFGRLSDGAETVERYSDGFYSFIDPIYTADDWRIVAIEVEEGQRSNGDGLPEVGEEIGVELTLVNQTSRTLEGVEIEDLWLEKEAVRGLATSDWDPNRSADREMTFVLDGEAPVPDASPSQVVTATDGLDVWIGTASVREIDFVASVRYWDHEAPVDAAYRRTQEVGFRVELSDGTSFPSFRCDHIDLEEDTDGDGVFESGERGAFTATLCNIGTWEGRQVVGRFNHPPPIGSWSDEAAPFPDLNPTECQPSNDDYAWRVDTDECGAFSVPMTVDFLGSQQQPGVTCPITIQCAPYQSVVDEKNEGAVSAGAVVQSSIGITNIGAATLTINSVQEASGASDTTVTSFPSTLEPQGDGTIEVSIDTTALAPGSHERTFTIISDANNNDESQSVVRFAITAGAGAVQVTTEGIDVGTQSDTSGSYVVYGKNGDIYVTHLFTGEETRITATSAIETDARIDGDHIVFSRNEGDPSLANVVLYDLASGTETTVADLTVRQTNPDVFDRFIVWEDDRAGGTTADIYGYTIGVSPTNGRLLVELGADRAATMPRIDGGYLGFLVKVYSSPVSFSRDVGYLSLTSGSPILLNLSDRDPCRVGSGPVSVFEDHLAFECDCGDACDDDNMIYSVNMAVGGDPVRLTCDAGLDNDREHPAVIDGEVLYHYTDTNDIYRVALGAACQTEVPLHVGSQTMSDPSGDPRTGAYVFEDDRTGRFELWGSVPAPPVEVGLSSFDLQGVEIVQDESYPFQVEIRNRGTEDLDGVDLKVLDGSVEIFSETVSTIASGATVLVSGLYSTGGVTEGPHVLTAVLDPPPAGDADASNHSLTLEILVLDQDNTPPVISEITVKPGSGSDGDPYLEAGEGILIEWTASDSSGISETHASLLGIDHPGSASAAARYSAELDGLSPGVYQATLVATDGDDSPSTTAPVSLALTVHPGAPEVSSTFPLPEQTDVDTRALVHATLSVEMNAGTLTADTFGLAGPGGPIAGSVGYDDQARTVTFQPDLALAANSSYAATLKGGAEGIQDIRGNSLSADYSWTFATNEPTCVDSLVVSSQTLATTQKIQACQKITVEDVTILAPAVVTFHAGESIVFGSGFVVGEGAGLVVMIDSCCD